MIYSYRFYEKVDHSKEHFATSIKVLFYWCENDIAFRMVQR